MAADPLAALKDIHLPAPIHTWPIAPGWLFLYGLATVMIGWGLYRLARHYKENGAKRTALKLLLQLQQAYLKQASLEETCTHINALLKRVALVYYPRTTVADLHGQIWLDFLSKTSRGLDLESIRAYLVIYPYQKKQQDSKQAKNEITPLIEIARAWIKQQRRSR